MGNDLVFTGSGFDFVFAKDGERDTIDCNDEGLFRLEIDEGLDTLVNCLQSLARSATSADTGESSQSIVIDY
ncbi:MAG: hypothetical protein H0X71_09765 [Rubrobacter sp.]|nr:hypothetical protein [Rubrobacter sp.]